MLVLSVLVVALVATPAPVPKPTPTNPFNLNPIPPPVHLPVIGVTRARPVCSAIRQAMAPAVQAAMKNDQLFGGFKTNVYDYTVRETESSRDLRLMQMDHNVDLMVKSVDALEEAVKSPTLDVPATASPEDAKTLRDARAALQGVLNAQKTNLDAMSGFVETEQAMANSVAPAGTANQTSFTPNNQQSQSQSNTQGPSGFLRDYNTVFKKNLNEGSMSLTIARLLNNDLTEMQVYTAKREGVATAIIVPAAHACSANAAASPTPAPAPLPSGSSARPQG